LNDELIAEAELGDEAKRFLESDLWRCLNGMAEQEVAIAREALESVDPTDAAKIRELQNHAKLFRTFETWVKELLHRGNNALEIFKQERDA
jgi:hypothetical protein